MAGYLRRVTAGHINALITAETVNGHVNAEKVNSLVSAATVNGHVSSEKVNSLVSAATVNGHLSAEKVNSLLAIKSDGEVGSYALLAHKSSGAGGSAGDIFDGNTLAYAGFQTSSSDSSWNNAYPLPISGVVLGKWKLMGTTSVSNDGGRLRASLFLRVE